MGKRFMNLLFLAALLLAFISLSACGKRQPKTDAEEESGFTQGMPAETLGKMRRLVSEVEKVIRYDNVLTTTTDGKFYNEIDVTVFDLMQPSELSDEECKELIDFLNNIQPGEVIHFSGEPGDAFAGVGPAYLISYTDGTELLIMYDERMINVDNVYYHYSNAQTQ